MGKGGNGKEGEGGCGKQKERRHSSTYRLANPGKKAAARRNASAIEMTTTQRNAESLRQIARATSINQAGVDRCDGREAYLSLYFPMQARCGGNQCALGSSDDGPTLGRHHDEASSGTLDIRVVGPLGQ
jgi:hypothetical protein